MVGQHMRVVLDVLPQLGPAGVFQPGLEAGQHLVQRQLRRRIHAFVTQRDVAGLAHLVAEGQAHNARLHGVQRVGFGVESHQLGRLQTRQPAIEGRPVQHGVVLRGDHGHGFGRCLGVVTHVVRCALIEQVGGGARLGFGPGRRRRCGRRGRAATQLGRLGAETEAREEVEQGRRVGLAQGQSLQLGPLRHVRTQVAVGLDGDEAAPLGQPIQGLAQVLARDALDGVCSGDHAVERAMLGDPLHGRFRPHLLHTGHVVHGIPDQGQVVDDEVRWHAELGHHARHVELLVGHGVDQGDVLGHQLGHVLVAGGDHHAVTGFGAHLGKRADGVIGLDAGHFQDGPAHQPHHLVDGLDLGAQVVGHGRTVPLVLGVPLVAEGRALGVKHAHGMFARHLVTQATQHVDHAVHRAGGLALRPAQVGHGVESAVQVAGAVDQQQGRPGFGRRRGHIRGVHAPDCGAFRLWNQNSAEAPTENR